MASEWPTVRLGDVAKEVTVGYVGTMADQYSESGVLFLRSLNVRPFSLDLGEVKYVSHSFHSKIQKSALSPGDVVIVRTGRPGTCAVIPDGLGEVNCSDLVIVRCGPTIRPHFACYWINAMAGDHVHAHSVGAVQQHFNVSSAKLIPMPLPDLREQDRVLGVLRSLDDRIDLLRQTNTTLEAIAQALFKSWFVDFDPVRAKAEGREPQGMDAATAALFPSEFEESHLGLIPKGWRVSQVGGLGRLVKGCSYKGAGLSDDEGSYMFNLGCFNERRVFAYEKVKRYTGAYRETQQVKAGDLIMANTDMTQQREILGRAMFVPTGFSPGFVSHHVFKVSVERESADSWKRFLFFTFQQSAFRDRAVGHATGTTVLALPKDSAEKCPLVEPPRELVLALDAKIERLLARIESSLWQSKTLESLRDTLLPRLISGKLRLPEAEAAVEEAFG